jgi:4a-hydroxytetrahydrobiopterin dehydratase
MSNPALIDHKEIDAALAGSTWKREGDHLVLESTQPTFLDALAFVNAVGDLAEDHDHHPDIDIRYTKVILSVSTHVSNGLTQRDLDFARSVDELL